MTWRQATIGNLGKATLIALMMAVAGCAASAAERKIDFDLTGTVLDAQTNKPVEGAYVLAAYLRWEPNSHNARVLCLKTRGMYTGKDGQFRFPVENLDGMSPGSLSAIKQGYFSGQVVAPERAVWQDQGAAAYAGRDLFLNPQDAAKPSFAFAFGGHNFCQDAKTREDAAAAIEFSRITLAEMVRLGAAAQAVDSGRALLKRLESLPSAPAK